MASAQENRTTSLRGEWPLVTACFFAVFTAYTNAFLLGPLLDPMSRDLGQPVSVLGQLAALTFIPWGVSAPLIGSISDRYGRKRVLLTGLFGMALAGFAATWAPDFWTLALCRFLTGVFGGCIPPTCIAALGDRFTGRTRGIAMSIAATGISVGLLAGLPGIAYLIESVGWRGGFFAAGCIALGSGCFTLFSFPNTPQSGEPTNFLGTFAWTRTRPPWYLIGGNVFEKILTAVFLTYVPVLLIRQYGVSLSSLAGLLTMMSVGTLIGNLAGGPLVGYRGRFYLIAAVAAAEGGLLLFQFSLAPPLALSIAAGLLFSLANNVSRAVVMDALVGLAPRSGGTIIGFFATSNQFGQTIGASIGGLAIAWGGFETIGLLSLAAALGAVFLYAAITTRLLPPG